MFFCIFQRNDYVKYAKVFPFAELFGFKVTSKWYRKCVGVTEVICGLAMAVIPHREFVIKCFLKRSRIYLFSTLADKIKNTANVTLLLLMLLAVYSHLMVNDPFERTGPSLVFTFMLSGRLVVWYQVNMTSRAPKGWKRLGSH